MRTLMVLLCLLAIPVAALEFEFHLEDPLRIEGGEAAFWGDSTWTDYHLQMTLALNQLQGDLNILFRIQENGFAYGITLSPEEIWVRRFVGQWQTHMPLGRIRNLDLAQKEVHLEIIVQGFAIQVLLDGQLIVDRVERGEHYPGGYIGVHSDGPVVNIKGLSVQGNLDPAMQSVIPGYFPKGDPRAGGVEHIMLIYNNAPDVWTVSDALPYVTYQSPELKIQDWFFDTLLFLALRSPFDRAFDSPKRATPAIKEDWQWFLDNLFRPDRQLAAFDEAVRAGREALGDDEYKVKFIVMIPNPMAQIQEFGEVNGQMLSFDPQGRTAKEITADRFAAVRWYMDEFLEKWEETQYPHLEFLGYYWVEEMSHSSVPGEADLIRQTAQYIHDRDLFFFWIPWFNAAGHREWQELGFDLAIHQPNYMFNDGIPLSRFEAVTNEARLYHQGIEIEADGHMRTSPQARERFRNYLRAAVTYGFTDAALAYYQDVKVFSMAATSKDPEFRAIYDDLYRFVKGEWTEGL